MSTLLKTKDNFNTTITQESSGVGRVLDVREWPGSDLIEIDLHLPAVDMLEWREVMQIIFSKNNVCIPEIVPFGWDTETATCSLIVNTELDSDCATWAKQLRRSEQVEYTNICACSEKLHLSNLIVGIGDTSNLAFLLALEQITPSAYRFEALAFFKISHTAKLFKEYFNTRIIPVTNQKDIVEWLVPQQYCANHTSFYLGGDSCFNNNIWRYLRVMNFQNIYLLPFGEQDPTILY